MSTETPKTPTPRPSQEIATVGDVKQATHEEKRATWLSTVVAVVTIVGAVLGAYFFAIDRAEAAGVREAFDVKKALADHIEEERAAHKEYRAEQREDMRRLERKTDAMLLRWNIPNPAPVP